MRGVLAWIISDADGRAEYCDFYLTKHDSPVDLPLLALLVRVVQTVGFSFSPAIPLEVERDRFLRQ